MTAADGLRRLEARAAVWTRGRVLLVSALVAGALLLLASCWHDHVAAQAEGEVRVLSRQLASEQRQRHADDMAIQEAHRVTVRAKAIADSSEAHARLSERQANVAEARSDALARQVRLIDSTHLAVRITPTSAESSYTVPAPVTAYIAGLVQTIAEKNQVIADKDAALEARGRELAADSVEQRRMARQLARDSTVITTSVEKSAALEKEIPRFGFKVGVVTGALAVLALLHFLK